MKTATDPVDPIHQENPRLNPPWTSDRYYVLLKLRQALEQTIAEYVSPRQQQQDQIVALDMGCGTMPYRSLFTAVVSQYLGADLASNPAADLGIDPATGKVDLQASSVDLVISTQVLEHVESPAAYLAEAHRLCKAEGLLILSTHGYWPYHPIPTDYWRWTGAGLQKLLSDNQWEVMTVTGVLGFASASACLVQDALLPKIRRPFKRVFAFFMQRCIGFLDSLYSSEQRQENAAVYLILARPVFK
ncbi:MAG: class I SAM-dependent methyltransferase [Acaryochloridaceae cyanobacterium CSU_5_19]|nr:class I SAM-dependent methyltransferase [Acaryochloridaceae cyanobacterium CSU_5_19]